MGFNEIMNIVNGGSGSKKKKSAFSNVMTIVNGGNVSTQTEEAPSFNANTLQYATPDSAARAVFENEMNTYLNMRNQSVKAAYEGREYDTSGFGALETQIRANPYFADYQEQFEGAVGDIDWSDKYNKYVKKKANQYEAALTVPGYTDPELEELEAEVTGDSRYAAYAKETEDYFNAVWDGVKNKKALADSLGITARELPDAMKLVTNDEGKYKNGKELYNTLINLYNEREENKKDKAMVDVINKRIDIVKGFSSALGGDEFKEAVSSARAVLEQNIKLNEDQIISANNGKEKRSAAKNIKSTEDMLKDIEDIETMFISSESDISGTDREALKADIEKLKAQKADTDKIMWQADAKKEAGELEEAERLYRTYAVSMDKNDRLDKEISEKTKLLNLAEMSVAAKSVEDSVSVIPDIRNLNELESEIAKTEGLDAKDKISLTYLLGGEEAAKAVDISDKEIDEAYLISASEAADDVARAELEGYREATYEDMRADAIESAKVYFDSQNAAYMNDIEKQTYVKVYLENGRAAAEEYLSSVRERLNARAGHVKAENVKGKWLAEALYTQAAGLDQFLSGMNQRLHGDLLPTTAAQYASAEVREDIEKREKWTGLYDAGVSIGNMAPAIAASILMTHTLGPAGAGLSAGAVQTAASAASSALMGMSASGNAYGQALREGYSKEQANTYSVMVGASEAALQYALGGISKLGGTLSLGKVGTKAISKLGGVTTRLAGNAFVQTAVGIAGSAASEAAEEYLQTHLEKIFRNIAFYEENEIDPLDEEALYSALLGAMTGGFLEGFEKISGTDKYKEFGSTLTATGLKKSIVEAAVDANMETSDLARLLKAGKIKGEANESYSLGRIAEEYMEADPEGWQKIIKNAEEKVKKTNDEKTKKADVVEIVKDAVDETISEGEMNAEEVIAESAKIAADAQAKIAEAFNIASEGRPSTGQVLRYDMDGNVIPDISENARIEDDVFKALAAGTGLKFAIMEHMEVNGIYDATTDTVYISSDAQNGIMTVVAHELTHFSRKWAPQEYNALKTFIINYYENQKKGSFAALVRKNMNEINSSGIKGLSVNFMQASDEVIARTCEMFLDGKSQDLIEQMAASNPSFAERVISFLMQASANIKKVLGTVKTGSAEALMLKKNIDSFEKARKLWQAAYKKAGENYRALADAESMSAALGEGAAYEIRRNKRGDYYVKATRQIITGDDPKIWKRQATAWFDELLGDKSNITFMTIDGHPITITKQMSYADYYSTVGKMVSEDAFLDEDGYFIEYGEEDYGRQLRAAVHLDEIIRIVKLQDMPSVRDHKLKHNDFGAGGWKYLKFFFMDADGTYYQATLNVAKQDSKNIAYTVNQISKRKFPVKMNEGPVKDPLSHGSSGTEENPSAFDAGARNTIVFEDAERSQENSENQENYPNVRRGSEEGGEEVFSAEAVQKAEEEYKNALEARDKIGRDNKLKAQHKRIARLLYEEKLYAVPASMKKYEEGIKLYAQMYGETVAAREALKKADPNNLLLSDTREDADKSIKTIAAKLWDARYFVEKEKNDYEKAYVLTDEEKQAARYVADGVFDINKISYDLNKQRVSEYADILKREEKAKKDLRAFKTKIEEGYLLKAARITANSDMWKDKMAIINDINTPQRNAQAWAKNDAEGKKELLGLFSEVTRHNAQRTRYVKEIADELNSKKYDALESALIQAYGEGVENGGLDRTTVEAIETYAQREGLTDRVIEGAEILKKAYSKMYDDLQDALARSGYKPAGHIKNYFPHIGDGNDPLTSALKKFDLKMDKGTIVASDISGKIEEISVMASGKNFNAEGVRALIREMYGIDEITSDALNTKVTGNTENFKPGKKFSANLLKRYGIKSNYNALKGFDAYAEAISRVIYHTDDIKTIRSVVAMLRERFAPEHVREQIAEINRSFDEETDEPISYEDKQNMIERLLKEEAKVQNEGIIKSLEEYANLLAGKKSRYDRTAEYAFFRKGMLVFGRVLSFIGRNMIAFNVSTAITNILPLGQAMGEVSTKSLTRAAIDTIKGQAKKDSFVDKSDFLTNRRGIERTWKTGWDKFQESGYWMMKTVDEFTSEVVARGFYNDAISKGMNEAEAMTYSNERAAQLMGDRSLGAQPNIFSSNMLKMITQFQFENFNFFNHYLKDMPKEYKRMTASAAASSMTKSLIGIYLANGLLRMLRGSGGTVDPIDLILGFARDAQDNDEEKEWRETFVNIVREIVEEVPVIGTAIGGGRYPIMTPVSNWDSFDDFVEKITDWETSSDAKRNIEDLFDLTSYLLPIGGYSQLKKNVKGIVAFAEGGVYGETNGEKYLKYPVNNWIEGVQSTVFGPSSTKSARDYYSGYDAVNAATIAKDMIEGKSFVEAWENEGGLEALTARETEFYKVCREYDFDRREFVLLAAQMDALDADEKAALIDRDYVGKEDFLYEAFVLTKDEIEDYNKVSAWIGAKEWHELHEAESLEKGVSDAQKKAGMINEKNLPEEAKDMLYLEEVLTEKQRDTLDGLAEDGIDISAREFFDISSKKSDKDEYGDTVSGSKTAKQAAAINELGLSYEAAGKLAESVGLNESKLYETQNKTTDNNKNNVIDACLSAGWTLDQARDFYKRIKGSSDHGKIKLLLNAEGFREKDKISAASAVFTSEKERAVYELSVSVGALDESMLTVYSELKEQEKLNGVNYKKEDLKLFCAKKGLRTDQVSTIYLLECTDKVEYNKRLDVLLKKSKLAPEDKIKINNVLKKK